MLPGSGDLIVSITELCDQAHEVAAAIGYWSELHETDQPFIELQVLANHALDTVYLDQLNPALHCRITDGIPSGIAADLARLVIQVANIAEEHEIDLADAIVRVLRHQRQELQAAK